MHPELFLKAFVFVAATASAGCAPSEVAIPNDTQGGTPSREEILKAWSEGRPLRLPNMPDPAQLHDIDELDPAYGVISAFATSVKMRHSQSGVSERVIDYTKQVKGRAAEALFPNHRFFVCQWHDSSAYFIDTLALDKRLRLTSIGSGHRNDQSFGEFLAEHKVRITNEEDARLVWDAFCEIRRWHSKSEVIERDSDRVWHLGVLEERKKGLGKAYYEVHLDEDSTVESAKWTIEDKIEGRK